MRKTTYRRFFFLLFFSMSFSLCVSGQIIGRWCVSANNDTLQEAWDVWVNNDGSLILGGYVGSNGLVMKVNTVGEGQVVWKNYITNCFSVIKIVAFDDTSYLCLGDGISADTTTGNHWGSKDVVLARINLNGAIIWKKYYGGSKADEGVDLLKTTDGNFAVVARTYSTDGQVTATNPLTGFQSNAWVFKIDRSGNLLWQKSLDYPGTTYTGYGNRVLIANDQQLFVLANYNKGYLIDQGSGAVSFFPYSINGNPGVIHSSLISMCKSYEGDAYLFLYSSQSSTSPTIYFNCVKKISTDGTYISTDTLRNYQDISNSPSSRGLIPMPGGNYLAAGTTDDPWATTFPWNQDGFVYNSVTRQTDLITGTQYRESISTIKLLPGGTGAVVVGYSDGICAPAADPALQLKDLWMVRFNLTSTIRGNVYIDANNNNTQEVGETTPKDVRITSTSAGTRITTQPSSTNGSYRMSLSPGAYTTKLQLQRPYYTYTPDSINTVFGSYSQSVTQNFALHPIAGIRDYAVSFVSPVRVRPGFVHDYNIACSNNGTDTLHSRDLLFIKDHRYSFTSAIPLPSSVSGDSIIWNLPDVLPAGSISISLKLTAGTIPQVNINDTLRSSVYIDSAGDAMVADNLLQIAELVSGSYDPNDKQENYAGNMPVKDVIDGKSLDYLIRFQNTGNDTAFTIVVRDTLDVQLDASSFAMLDASHAWQLSIKDGKYIAWTFKDIKLVDSFHNEPASHGYISYRIKPKLPIGIDDVISNRAAIYFDFNPAVLTNNQLTKVGGPAVPAVWTGAVSVAWEDPLNWNTNKLPDINTAVVIPAAVPNYPEISSSADCYTIRIDPAATVLIKTGFRLNVTGKTN